MLLSSKQIVMNYARAGGHSWLAVIMDNNYTATGILGIGLTFEQKFDLYEETWFKLDLMGLVSKYSDVLSNLVLYNQDFRSIKLTKSIIIYHCIRLISIG